MTPIISNRGLTPPPAKGIVAIVPANLPVLLRRQTGTFPQSFPKESTRSLGNLDLRGLNPAPVTPFTVDGDFDYAALAGCDLVVEAVFEDMKVKAEVTARAEAVLAEGAIFATNTSTLPISDLARASRRPGQFIGIHFFSPVDKMMLVEIIMGEKTGDKALATFEHGRGFYIVGSLVWCAVIGLIGMVVSLRAYRKE